MRIGKIRLQKLPGNTPGLKVYFIVLAILIKCDSALAQNISGIIKDASTNEPLSGVSVIADDTSGTASGIDGKYSLNLSPGKHALRFTFVSFQALRKDIFLNPGENLVLDVQLNQSSRQLNEIVVSAGKFEQKLEDVTVSMEVLKPQLVEKRNTVTMEDAVDYIPGVNIIDGQANIRGGSGWSYGAGSRVQVLVDDLPQLTADAGDTKWTFLPVENLEQVEVIKGASSVLFGSSALNGIINFRTAYPRDTPLTRINTFSALYDKASVETDKKYSLSYSKQLSTYSGGSFLHSRKINRLDLVASGNFFLDNGYRQGENEQRGRLGINGRYRFKKQGLSAGLSAVSMVTNGSLFFLWKNDTSGAYIPATNTLSDYTTYRTTIDPSLTYISSKGNSHKIRTRWFNSTNKNNTNQNSNGDLFYAEYQFQRHFKSNLTLTSGLVTIFSLVKSQMYGNHDGNQVAAYAQGDYSTGRFNFSGGARAEQSKVDSISDKWTPVFRAGINFRLFEATHLRASAGQGYRFPSVAERFVRTNVSGINIFPNVELQPEKGVSYEAGIRQGVEIARWKAFVDVAVFENDYRNMMEFAFAQWDPSNPDLIKSFGFKSFNVGKTRIRGVDASMAVEGNIGSVHISGLAGYTYLDPRQLTYDSIYVLKVGKPAYLGSDSSGFLKYRYKHMLKGDVDAAYRSFSFGLSIRYASRMQNIDKIFLGGLLDLAFPPGLGIGDYLDYHKEGDWIIDTRVSCDIHKNLRIFFIVKNVFNHIYMQRPADMQPPRIFVVQAGFHF